MNDHPATNEIFKLMVLDQQTQSLRPLCMTDMMQNQMKITRKSLWNQEQHPMSEEIQEETLLAHRFDKRRYLYNKQ